MTVLQWTPNGGEDFFGQLQWDNLVYSTNVFNSLANGGETAQLAKWDLPIDGGPAIVQNRSNCLTGDVITDAQGNPEPCKFCFSGTYDPNDTSTIRQYTNVVLGSNAGYEQTWGRSCGSLPLINGVFRGGAGGQGANQAYDLTPATSAVGFPSLVSAMPQTTMHLQWSECGDTGGCYNIFTDIYLHEVNDPSLLPTNAPNGGTPQTQYQGTVNGISQNDTKLWNFNFWHNQFPSCFNNAQQVTNGTYMGTVAIEAGKPVDIYLRREGFSGNNFAFLAFSFNPAQTNHDFDVSAYINWATSTATGAGTFMDVVWNNPNGARATVAAQMASPPTLGSVTPLARTLRPPAGDMVIDGIQQGSEVWGVNPSGNVAEICYDQLGFTVDGVEHGKLVNDGCTACSDFSLIAPSDVIVGNSYNISVSPAVASIRVLAGGQLVHTINGSSGSWSPSQADCDLAGASGFTIVVQESINCPQCTLATGIQCTTGNSGDNCPDCSSYTATGIPSNGSTVSVGDVFDLVVSPASEIDVVRVFAGPCLVESELGNSLELEITQEMCDVAQEVSGGQISIVVQQGGCSACPIAFLICGEDNGNGCSLCSDWSTDLQVIQLGANAFNINPPAGVSNYIWYLEDSAGLVRATGTNASTAFTFTQSDCDAGPFSLFTVEGDCDPCLLAELACGDGTCLSCSDYTISGVADDGFLIEGNTYTINVPQADSMYAAPFGSATPLLQSNSNSLSIIVTTELCQTLSNGLALYGVQDGCQPCLVKILWCIPNDEPMTGGGVGSGDPKCSPFSCCIAVQEQNKQRINDGIAERRLKLQQWNASRQL